MHEGMAGGTSALALYTDLLDEHFLEDNAYKRRYATAVGVGHELRDVDAGVLWVQRFSDKEVGRGPA